MSEHAERLRLARDLLADRRTIVDGQLNMLTRDALREISRQARPVEIFTYRGALLAIAVPPPVWARVQELLEDPDGR